MERKALGDGRNAMVQGFDLFVTSPERQQHPDVTKYWMGGTMMSMGGRTVKNAMKLVITLAFGVRSVSAYMGCRRSNALSQPSSCRSCQCRETTTLRSLASNADVNNYKHGVAILTMPATSADRIANEAILTTAIQKTSKLSVVLRSADENDSHSLAALRRYVGEVYSMLWDCAMGFGEIMDVVVYPQNLPNAAPEQWLYLQQDLDFVCSHDSICGWTSSASGRGTLFLELEGGGVGGLDSHVAALNADRLDRDLPEVASVHADPWPRGACVDFQEENHVLFIDDDSQESNTIDEEPTGISTLLGGARIPAKSLFKHVAVGGTFDGMHYGHRKLLTLAVSSVMPQTGRLLIGVTVDEMLQHKKLSELIPPLKERMEDVRRFLDRLAPGMKNRVKILPISDSYGPPGSKDTGDQFDALVLSHETLETGHLLNEHRVKSLGLAPLSLLCTRRTEPYGMSSTALRKLKSSSRTPV